MEPDLVDRDTRPMILRVTAITLGALIAMLVLPYWRSLPSTHNSTSQMVH
jgi:hypothetical protein